eukprot:6491642-Amphidinium_carterae.2
MAPKFRLVGRKTVISANRLPPVSASGWQDVERGVVDQSLLSTGCYLEVKVACGGGIVCSMVLEVVWFSIDADGCSLDVRALGASHPVGQEWIEQQKNMQSFPQFHLCSQKVRGMAPEAAALVAGSADDVPIDTAIVDDPPVNIQELLIKRAGDFDHRDQRYRSRKRKTKKSKRSCSSSSGSRDLKHDQKIREWLESIRAD